MPGQVQGKVPRRLTKGKGALRVEGAFMCQRKGALSCCRDVASLCQKKVPYHAVRMLP